jgi:hypothetical protein
VAICCPISRAGGASSIGATLHVAVRFHSHKLDDLYDLSSKAQTFISLREAFIAEPLTEDRVE